MMHRRLADITVLPRLRWKPPFLPPRIHSFLYSKADLFVSLAAALLAYIVLSGQAEPAWPY